MDLRQIRASLQARPREYAIKNYLMELGTVATYKVSHAYWDRMIRMFNQIFRSELQPVLHIRAARSASHWSAWDFRAEWHDSDRTQPRGNISCRAMLCHSLCS